MAINCDSDLAHLKAGKKVMLKSYGGLLASPQTINACENYWLLIGSKGEVVGSELQVRDQCTFALIKFDKNIQALGLDSHSAIENSVWVSIDDLKFVCRY